MLILFCWGLLWVGDSVIVTDRRPLSAVSVYFKISSPYITGLYFISECNRCTGIILQLWTWSHKAFFHRSGLNQPNYLLLHQTENEFSKYRKMTVSCLFLFCPLQMSVIEKCTSGSWGLYSQRGFLCTQRHYNDALICCTPVQMAIH